MAIDDNENHTKSGQDADSLEDVASDLERVKREQEEAFSDGAGEPRFSRSGVNPQEAAHRRTQNLHKAAQAVDARNKKREADKEDQQRRALIAMSELAEVQSDNLIKLRQQVELDSVQAGINFDKSHRLERRVYNLNWVIVFVSIVTGFIAAAGVWVTMQSGTDISPEIEALTESVVELRSSVSELERKIGQLSPADSEEISAPTQPQPAPTPVGAPSDSVPSTSDQREP